MWELFKIWGFKSQFYLEPWVASIVGEISANLLGFLSQIKAFVSSCQNESWSSFAWVNRVSVVFCPSFQVKRTFTRTLRVQRRAKLVPSGSSWERYECFFELTDVIEEKVILWLLESLFERGFLLTLHNFFYFCVIEHVSYKNAFVSVDFFKVYVSFLADDGEQ